MKGFREYLVPAINTFVMDVLTIALIPARGGSTRVPGKNLEEVGGTPLVGRAITCAQEAECVDRVILSTDDPAIASVGERYGAEVPFLRPAELADDTAPMAGVVTHALDALAVEDELVIVILQPTVPFRTGADVDAAVQRLDVKDATSVVSVTRYETPPQWACTVDTDGWLVPTVDTSPLWSDQQVRSQDLQPLVHPNGAIFAIYSSAWREHQSFYTGETVGYEMPISRSVDIDTPEDLAYARYLASERE